MKVSRLSIDDALLNPLSGQQADILVGNLVDERHGGEVTIGHSRYGPHQSLTETMAVDDTLIILEGQLSVSSDAEP